MLRTSVFVIAGFDAAIWLLHVKHALFNLTGFPISDRLTILFAAIATLLVAVFALPALILALKRSYLGLALGLAVIPLIIMVVTF